MSAPLHALYSRLTVPPIPVYAFFSHYCPECKRLGVPPELNRSGKLGRALTLLKTVGFDVIYLNIDRKPDKEFLLSITCRLRTVLPVVITPFAILENPGGDSVEDFVDGLLGRKILTKEEGYVYLEETEKIKPVQHRFRQR